MINIRKSIDRGKFNWGWLDARYTFSFARYYDPNNMGFHSLRVINQDLIAQKGGFGTHPHRDMEIISFIIRGSLEHKDTMGYHNTITPGVIQIMSAGTGVEHSEFNPSSSDTTEMLQIWVEPRAKNLAPSYSEFNYEEESKTNELNLIVSGNKEDKVGYINQDVRIYYLDMDDFNFKLEGNSYWFQMIKGSATISGNRIEDGDGVSVDTEAFELENGSGRALLFEIC